MENLSKAFSAIRNHMAEEIKLATRDRMLPLSDTIVDPHDQDQVVLLEVEKIKDGILYCEHPPYVEEPEEEFYLVSIDSLGSDEVHGIFRQVMGIVDLLKK